MAEGNRKDPRARVLNMTVRYKSATVDEFIENHSHDISRGGIFIKTRAPFPAGTLLKFEVRIAGDQRLMQGVGRVVWRREPERAEEGYPAGMGIKFIKTGEGAAELISQIVAARQGEESSFDAGARENGAVSDPPRSEGRHSVPAAPEASEATSTETPSLKVESAPAEGEIYVSSPPKKRVPVTSETRKVVLHGTAVDVPSSDKTPISTRAREVSAQAAGSERAPSRPAPAARGSIVDETTAPRARSVEGQSRRATQQQSSPSVLGLVAILGAVGITLLVVKLLRGPESAPPAPEPPAVTSAAPTPPVPPPPPAEPAPSAAEPAPEAVGTPGAEAEPAAAAPSEPAAGGAAATGPSPPSAAPSPAPTGSAAKPPAAVAPGTAAPAQPPATPAPAGAAKPAPAAPKPPAAVAPPVPAAPKPSPDKPPAPTGAQQGSSAPGQEPATAGSAGAGNDAKARPAEPAKKRPPAATAPSEEPAAKPAEPSPTKPAAPSDDNPY